MLAQIMPTIKTLFNLIGKLKNKIMKTSENRRLDYKRILDGIIEMSNRSYDYFICTKLSRTFNYSNYPELHLFRESEQNVWIHWQLFGTGKRITDAQTKRINEIRIMILQLCIEMTK